MGQFLAEGEESMWAATPKPTSAKLSDQAINEKYDLREKRIVTEVNREKLQNFVESLDRPNYIEVRPYYQRRERWSIRRQSQLIESFIINIPVPPLFLYEQSYNSYEVMDGQQRIAAVHSFYKNEFALTGLDLWPELNGKTYSTLPTKIRSGIDRRSISYVVLLKESAESVEEALLLKQLVFERLNTGGVKLAHQEVRNCLYQGALNTLLLELSRDPLFAQVWGIPGPTEDEQLQIPDELCMNPLYQEMEDVEIVLRFFALRHAEHFRRGMQGFLDLYMIRSRSFDEFDIDELRKLFRATLSLGHAIFGDLLFRPFDSEAQTWSKRPQKAFYDAVMVALSRNLSNSKHLIASRQDVIERTKQLFIEHPKGTFTGRGNSKADIQERIRLFEEMIESN